MSNPIKDFLKKNNMSDVAFGKPLGVTGSAVGQWKKNKRNPYRYYQQIEDIHKIPVSLLVTHYSTKLNLEIVTNKPI